MRALSKFIRLSPADRRLLASAALLLSAIRLGLWAFSFRRIQFLADWTTLRSRAGRKRPPHSVAHICWAVVAASRYVPGTRTCLPQALTGHVLLRMYGHPTSLRIGVAKTEG